jgi:myo-inositol-1(or 4)-monophosphatase
MNNPDLFLIRKIMKEQDVKVYRDFAELENLQASSNITKFVNTTIERLNNNFYNFFKEKRSNYSIFIKDWKNDVTAGATRSIYINCIAGIKNFAHSIPYFATVIAIKEQNKYITAAVNNYATQEMFAASSGLGAFLNDRRIRVSVRSELPNTIIGVKFGKNTEQNSQLISKLDIIFKINNCVILDLCQAAMGKLDGGIILDSNKEELEIGELFIKEARGSFEFLNEDRTSCIFSNSLIHNNLKKYIVI